MLFSIFDFSGDVINFVIMLFNCVGVIIFGLFLSLK